MQSMQCPKSSYHTPGNLLDHMTLVYAPYAMDDWLTETASRTKGTADIQLFMEKNEVSIPPPPAVLPHGRKA